MQPEYFVYCVCMSIYHCVMLFAPLYLCVLGCVHLCHGALYIYVAIGSSSASSVGFCHVRSSYYRHL